MADFTTPFRFLETLLSGPIDGRRKLYARLGREARDPIDELLSQALAFETRETVSLLGFLTAVSGSGRSEEHTSELQSLMRISYAVFCLKKKNKTHRYNGFVMKWLDNKHYSHEKQTTTGPLIT